jgi:phasin family protein
MMNRSLFPPSTARIANVDKLFALAAASLTACEDLVALNFDAARHQLGETQEAYKKILAARGAEELIAIPSLMTATVASQWLSYGRRLSEIASKLTPELLSALESIPAGLLPVLSMLRQASDSVNAEYARPAPYPTRPAPEAVATAFGMQVPARKESAGAARPKASADTAAGEHSA